MKRIEILLTLIFSLLVDHGQTKGDNVITIKNFNSFSELKKILLLEGYEFYQIDTAEGFFSTLYRPIEGSVYSYNLKVKIIGIKHPSGLKLTANYTSQYVGGSGSMTDASGSASYEQRRNISKRLSFDELNRIALKISSDIKYSKE